MYKSLFYAGTSIANTKPLPQRLRQRLHYTLTKSGTTRSKSINTNTQHRLLSLVGVKVLILEREDQ